MPLKVADVQICDSSWILVTFKDICSFEAPDANERTRERSDGGECFCVTLRSAPEFRPRVFHTSAPQLAWIISLTFQTPPSVKQDSGLKFFLLFALVL